MKLAACYYKTVTQQIIHGNCIEVMEGFDAGSFDIICTDPPYNLAYNGRAQNSLGSDSHEMFANDNLEKAEYAAFVARVTYQLGRVTQENAALYLFIDWRNYPVWAENIEKYFAPIKNCIVWDKGSIGMGHFYRFQHEFCIFAVRGDYKLNRHDLSDVWFEKREATSDYLHPTQKPVSLIQKILVDTPPEAKILDPFMGSGTTLMAAKMASRHAVGIELDPKYIEVAKNRLAQGMLFSSGEVQRPKRKGVVRS